MYYPKQIPYVLNKEFHKYIDYKEYLVTQLEQYCMCIWEMKAKRNFDTIIYNPILPDACIDIVIDFYHKTIHFAGFSKKTKSFPLSEKIDYLGVRLKPSAFYAIFHISGYEIMDHSIPFVQIESESSLFKIFSIKDVQQRIELLKQYLIQKIRNLPDKNMIEFVDLLYESPKEQRVYSIAEKFGYHRRHVFRIFKLNYGVSPKVLLNILRLHLCLTLLLEKNMELTEIAMRCGFYDQSHFIKEIKKYTGISPLQIFENMQQ